VNKNASQPGHSYRINGCWPLRREIEIRIFGPITFPQPKKVVDGIWTLYSQRSNNREGDGGSPNSLMYPDNRTKCDHEIQ